MAEVRLEQRDTTTAAVEVPRPADADVIVQRARPVLRENPNVGDAGVGAVAEREVDDAIPAAEDHGGLRPLLREDAEPVSLAAGEDHGDGAFHVASYGCAVTSATGGASIPLSKRKIFR